MDGLSTHIKDAHLRGLFDGIQISFGIMVTHSFFVDDILAFGILSPAKWFTLHYIILLYGAASGLVMNSAKSLLQADLGDSADLDLISSLFGVKLAPLYEGLSYLGFRLKSCKYCNVEWI